MEAIVARWCLTQVPLAANGYVVAKCGMVIPRRTRVAISDRQWRSAPETSFPYSKAEVDFRSMLWGRQRCTADACFAHWGPLPRTRQGVDLTDVSEQMGLPDSSTQRTLSGPWIHYAVERPGRTNRTGRLKGRATNAVGGHVAWHPSHMNDPVSDIHG